MTPIDPADLLTTTQIARLLSVQPGIVCDLFYRGFLREDLCPIIGRTRVVPRYYLSEIVSALRRRGVSVTMPSDPSRDAVPA